MEQQSLRKTFKEKLRPTPAQDRALDEVIWRCRVLYNTALEQRKTAWERCHVSVSRYDQEAELKDIRAEFSEYEAIHSHVLQDVLARLERTYQDFFRRIREGEKPGYPRFKGRNRYRSFTYKEYGNGARLDNGYLVLSKIGRIAVHWSRPMEGTPKTVTISREADGWYLTISCADVPVKPLPLTGQETGIDVGLKAFLVTADGVLVENPRYHRKAERYLAKCQQRVARREKGSKRCAKAVCLLAKAHQTVRRQRRDFHHKTALALVRQYDTIYVEAIQSAHLSRRPAPVPDGQGGYQHNGARAKAGLNQSIRDAGWSSFLTILTFKAASAGKRVEAVPPAYTTQDCSNVLLDGAVCGARVAKSLSVRTHVCPKCGYEADRDENAARNIQRRGQRLRGVPARAGAVNREPAGL
jgi:putative transposase